MNTLARIARPVKSARPFAEGLSLDPIADALAEASVLRIVEGREAGTYLRESGRWIEAATGRGLRDADADHLVRLGRAMVVAAPRRDEGAEDRAWELGYEVGNLGGDGSAPAGSSVFEVKAFASGLASGRARRAARAKVRRAAREDAAFDASGIIVAERVHQDGEYCRFAELGHLPI